MWNLQMKEASQGKVPSGKRFLQIVKELGGSVRRTPPSSSGVAFSQAHTGHRHGQASVQPGGGWAGSENLVKSAIGAIPDGFAITSSKRDRMHTKSGNVSDHYVGNKTAFAHDIGWGSGQPTPQSDAMASRIVSALGGPPNWGRKGGNFRTTVNGYGVQVIYKSNVGGNHYDHIHVGARKV